MNKTWDEAVRRYLYARAEITPNYAKQQARRAAYDARYGPCVGDTEGAECPVHGVHETSDPASLMSQDEVWQLVAMILAMSLVITGWVVWDWSLWVVLPLVWIAGQVAARTTARVQRWRAAR